VEASPEWMATSSVGAGGLESMAAVAAMGLSFTDSGVTVGDFSGGLQSLGIGSFGEWVALALGVRVGWVVVGSVSGMGVGKLTFGVALCDVGALKCARTCKEKLRVFFAWLHVKAVCMLENGFVRLVEFTCLYGLIFQLGNLITILLRPPSPKHGLHPCMEIVQCYCGHIRVNHQIDSEIVINTRFSHTN
jgi:hypothetical protein